MSSITIKDIARETGLSHQTVSKILNNSSASFNCNTRSRVFKAASDLGYKPNRIARSLKTGRTNRICIATMLGDIGQYAAPYASMVYAGISYELRDTDYQVTVKSFRGSGPEGNREELSDPRQFDGAIFLLFSRNYPDIKDYYSGLFGAFPIPVVGVSSIAGAIGVDNITVDCVEAGRLATDHLLEHGYESVGFVQPAHYKGHAADLKTGYLQAMASASRPVEDRYLYTARNFHFEDGYAWADGNIKEGVKLPRALMLFEEAFAFGAIRRFQEEGIRVPEDIALAAFGNIRDEALGVTGLTCTSQPALEKGRHAARRIRELLAGDSHKTEPVVDIVPTELVIRSSCGCGRKHTPVYTAPRSL